MDQWRDLKLMMKALGDLARLTITYYLARRQDVTVTELTDLLNISQPLVSWHLRKLRRAGLVETRRVGRQVYCSLNAERFQLCIQHLQGLTDPNAQIDPLPVGDALIEMDSALEE